MWPWRSPWHLGSSASSMYILSLSFDFSIHISAYSWPRHFKLPTIVVEKGTSGFRGITSSIYLNWNISIISCQIEIKLVLVKAEWQWLLFLKNIFVCHFRSRRMTSLKFQLRISFLFYVGLSHNLVKEIWVVHMTLRSYKISCDIEGHVDLWGQLQGKCIFFRNRWICQFITPSIVYQITSNFQVWSLKIGLPVVKVLRHQYF